MMDRMMNLQMTVHVVDESCPERRHAIQIVIFYPRIGQMPRVLVRIVKKLDLSGRLRH